MNDSPPRRVYSLSVLFILVAACSIVAAFLAPVVRAISAGPIGVVEAAMATTAGGLAAACLGGIVGLYHYRRGRGFLWGTLTGLVLGSALGPISLAPLEVVPTLFSLSLIGSAVLVGVAAFLRWSRRPPLAEAAELSKPS